MDLYKAEVVCTVCGISARQLDYWVSRGVVVPSKVLISRQRRRKLFLFSYKDLVRLKIIQSLRLAGVSLGTIQVAIETVEKQQSAPWESAWFITDGKHIFLPTDDPMVLKTLTGPEKGQLAMAIVAVEPAKSHVRESLQRFEPIDLGRYDAQLSS